MKELIAIQSTLKAPKSQLNKFGGYYYRNCEDILEAVKPLLSQHGAILTLTDAITEVGGRVYVKATATIKTEKEHVSVDGFAREAETKKGMDESQITGAASSYARKYALNGLFCIDDSRDADATNDHGKTEQKPKENKELIALEMEFKQSKSLDDINRIATKWRDKVNKWSKDDKLKAAQYKEARLAEFEAAK